MKTFGLAALIMAALVLMAGLGWADPSDQNGANAAAKAAAQAGGPQAPAPKAAAPKAEAPVPVPAAAPKAAAPAGDTNLPERVNSLEKQNVVLSEDVGKARLDQRMQMDELQKKQAAAIARLNQKVAATQKKLDAERAKQAKRNRNMWIAVGALALGVMAVH